MVIVSRKVVKVIMPSIIMEKAENNLNNFLIYTVDKLWPVVHVPCDSKIMVEEDKVYSLEIHMKHLDSKARIIIQSTEVILDALVSQRLLEEHSYLV